MIFGLRVSAQPLGEDGSAEKTDPETARAPRANHFNLLFISNHPYPNRIPHAPDHPPEKAYCPDFNHEIDPI
jgi:hypothetical protein